MQKPVNPDTTMEERFGLCPYATAQSLISGKWAVLILYYLSDGPVRFNELIRFMPNTTHATLSTQLKSLIEKGLVARKEDKEVPQKVDYYLTDIGMKFRPVLDAMREWGNQYIDYMKSGKE